QKLVLLDLVFLEIHRDAHQGPAEAILVDGIEVEIDVAIGVEAAVHARARLHRRQIVLLCCRLPRGAPFRCSRRNERTLDRTRAGLHLSDIAAADKAVRPVIEIVAVELVDAHADRARGNERVEVVFLRIEEAVYAGDGLVGVVSPDGARVGYGIVWTTDLG